MTLLAPIGLAAAILAGPIVLMYVLKLRRRAQVVPSTLLWERALDDVQANAPWQRLRPNILLLLQILALIALVLALARPAYSQTRAYAGDLVVVVDESYGMQAHDVKPSRFVVALRRAHQLAGQLAGGNVMSVVGMGAQPHLAIAESSDGAAISHAIDSLRAGPSSPNVLGALSLGASLARSGISTHLIILTSRESGIGENLPLAVPFPVDIERIGGRMRDLGITAFDASRSGSHTAAVLRVDNFGAGTESANLNLYADGQLADVRPVTVSPGQQQNLVWTALPGRIQTLRAALDTRDDVDVDKTAWAVVAAGSVRHILLVTSGDFFLQTGLALDPTAEVGVEPPASYSPAQANHYDLVVFDGYLPPSLPATSTLIVAPSAGSIGPLRFGAYAPAGSLTDLTTGQTGSIAGLLRYADLSDVHVLRSRTAHLPGWLQPVAGSDNLTLVAAGDSGTQRVGVIDFQLGESDWPLRISFPIVLQNLVHYLAPGLTVGAQNLNAGEHITLLAPPGTSSVTVIRPDGSSATLHPPFPPLVTTVPGLYRLRAGKVAAAVAARFFPSRPAPAGGPAILHLGSRGSSARHSGSAPVSIAWLAGLLGLFALSLEWWFAFKR